MSPTAGTLDDPVELSSSTDAASDSGAEQRKPREAWTAEQITALINCLKQNPSYQQAFLPGHKKEEASQTSKISANTMLRNIRKVVFPNGTTKTEDGIRSRITTCVKNYNKELTAISQTGQGLLLADMRAGPVKNAREQLLAVMPWWETMHIMMRDRASSEPDIVVTGAGTIKKTVDKKRKDPSLGILPRKKVTKYDTDSDLSAEEREGLSPAAALARQRGYDFEYDDEDSDSSIPRLRSLSEELASMDPDGDTDMDGILNTPRAPMAPKASSSSSLRVLPTLARLVDATKDDPQAAGASASSRADLSLYKGKEKVKDEPDLSPCKPSPLKQGKTRASIADQAMNEFGRFMAEDRQVRAEANARATAEREQTKRLKIEMKSGRDKDMETLGRQIESLSRQIESLALKVDAVDTHSLQNAQAIADLNVAITGFNATVTAAMAKVDIAAMILQALRPSTSSSSSLAETSSSSSGSQHT
ncbi:hypothetical protein OC834_005918 [Tilletia horrida]|nr:hypothetical protein OC834_005918 [Tilletia horrida]